MNLIDMHCDTICELLSEKTPGQDLKKNNLKVDIEKLKKGGSAAQFFACFVAMDEFLGKSRYEQAYESGRKPKKGETVSISDIGGGRRHPRGSGPGKGTLRYGNQAHHTDVEL